MSQPIVVEKYNPAWQQEFEALKAIYTEMLGTLVKSIEHVGSTAVPGLAAKPILDIDLVVESETQVQLVSDLLAKLGYVFRGDLGIPLRYAFGRSNDQVPYTASNRNWMPHHLYCCIEGSVSLRNHLALRKALLADGQLRDEYAALKEQLAAGVDDDIDAYVDGKSAFIGCILLQEGILPDEVSDIASQNRDPKKK